MKARQVIAKIESLGGEFVRQKGSHRRYRVRYIDADGAAMTVFSTVQVHAGRDLPTGTLHGVQADLEPALGKGWLL